MYVADLLPRRASSCATVSSSENPCAFSFSTSMACVRWRTVRNIVSAPTPRLYTHAPYYHVPRLLRARKTYHTLGEAEALPQPALDLVELASGVPAVRLELLPIAKCVLHRLAVAQRRRFHTTASTRGLLRRLGGRRRRWRQRCRGGRGRRQLG